MITRVERARWNAWATDADAPPETWIPRRDLYAILDALDAADALREFIEVEVMPRYVEMFQAAGLGTAAADSVVVEIATKILARYDAAVEAKA